MFNLLRSSSRISFFILLSCRKKRRHGELFFLKDPLFFSNRLLNEFSRKLSLFCLCIAILLTYYQFFNQNHCFLISFISFYLFLLVFIVLFHDLVSWFFIIFCRLRKMKKATHQKQPTRMQPTKSNQYEYNPSHRIHHFYYYSF